MYVGQLKRMYVKNAKVLNARLGRRMAMRYKGETNTHMHTTKE